MPEQQGRHNAGKGKPPRRPMRTGPRRAALDHRRKERRKKLTTRGTLGAVAATLLGVGLVLVVAREVRDPAPPTPAPSTTAIQDDAVTTLLVGTKQDEQGGDGRAVWLTLLTRDPDKETGSVIYIPAHTAVEVPGRGLQGLDDALKTGGLPLLLLTTENLLDVTIDQYLELSDADAGLVFDELGPLSVDVPAEVRVPVGPSQARILLGQGPQRLSSPFLVHLLYTVGVDGDDIELGSRHLAFWDAFFEGYEPEQIEAAFEASGGALAKSDVAPQKLASFFTALAAAEPAGRVLRVLPVTPLEVPNNRLYVTDEDEVRSFMDEVVGAVPGVEDEIRVQILNGNGVPGIGQQVAQRLVGRGYRVILSGNAPRLNYAKTLVIAYDSSPAGQALAQEARDLLGVGEVQVSAQEQGIVDLTIVVGKDFLRAP